MRKILILLLFLFLTSSAFAQFDVWVSSGASDSIGIDTTGNASWDYLYPAFLKVGNGIKFNCFNNDTLRIRADTTVVATKNYVDSKTAGASGSVDSVFVKDSLGTWYSNLNNLIRIEAGTGMQIPRSDSANCDVLHISYGGMTLSGDVSGAGTATITTSIGSSKVTSSMIVNGTITKSDIDTTGSFTFASAYKYNGNVSESILVTKGFTGATYLPLGGGQMTGNITFSGSQTVDGKDVSTLTDLGQTINGSEVLKGRGLLQTSSGDSLGIKAGRYLRFSSDSLIVDTAMNATFTGIITIVGNWVNTANPWADNEIASSSNWNTAYDSVNVWKNLGYAKATTTALGIASFSSSNFTVSTGAVSVKAGGIDSIEVDTTDIYTMRGVYKGTKAYTDSALITRGCVSDSFARKNQTWFFTFPEPSISAGTDDSVYIQYPVQKDSFEVTWYHYNPSGGADDQKDTIYYVGRVPMGFTGWDSLTYNYKTSSATSTTSSIKIWAYERTLDGGAITFIDSVTYASTSWTHVARSAKTLSAGYWLIIRVICNLDHTQYVYHDRPYVWGKR